MQRLIYCCYQGRALMRGQFEVRPNVAQVVDCVPSVGIRSASCEITYKTWRFVAMM